MFLSITLVAFSSFLKIIALEWGFHQELMMNKQTFACDSGKNTWAVKPCRHRNCGKDEKLWGPTIRMGLGVPVGINWLVPPTVSTGFPASSVVKNPPATQETQETRVWALGREDPLEKEMATHFSILPGKIPQTEEPGRLQSLWSQRVGHNLVTK